MKRSVLLFLIILITNTLFSQGESAVKVYYENTESDLTVYADNSGFVSKSVRIEMEYKGFRNIGTSQDVFFIPPNTKKLKLIELELTGQGKVSFGYEYTIYFGDVNAKHDDTFPYMLPFSDEIDFKLTQGYNGKFSHQSKKALDFTMPIGTKIVAARSGVIIDSKEDSNTGCEAPRCLDAANYITVLHNDGSFAQYYHLKQNGVVVALSDIVEQGQLIGYSGNTGFTSGAHLHFEVNISTLEGIKTVPTQFNIEGKKQLLKYGDMYASSQKK